MTPGIKIYDWRVRKGGKGSKLLFGLLDFGVSLFMVVASKKIDCSF
jgi:hypothetical protein